MRPERVFDGELVQAELTSELVELLLRGPAEVDPYHRVGFLKMLGDVGQGKPLGLENAFAVHPGHGIAHEYGPPRPSGASVVPSGSLGLSNVGKSTPLQRDERSQSFARCAAARILSRSFARASAPSGPRSITSRRPPSCSTTSRIVWRGTPGRMSRSAAQVRTRSHRIRRSCSDQGRCHRRLRRPALTTPVKVFPKSSRSLARTTIEYQRRQAEQQPRQRRRDPIARSPPHRTSDAGSARSHR